MNKATDVATPITSLRLPYRVGPFTSVPVEVISKPILVFPVERRVRTRWAMAVK